MPKSDFGRSLLSLEGIGKTYRMGEVDVPVLHQVDLAISSGEFLVVVGPSGSGKSTLLNIVGGIDAPTEGAVFFEGRNLADLRDADLTRYRRDNVGFVFQYYNLVPTLTARENVLVATELCDDSLDAGSALDLVGLADRADHFPSQLSGGEQQRVSIARAMAKRPRLLLCDEPTGALDVATGAKVLELLARSNREMDMAVLLITHNTAIEAMADRIVRLGRGTIVEVVENARPLPASEITW